MFNDKSIQNSFLNTQLKCKKKQCFACVNHINEKGCLEIFYNKKKVKLCSNTCVDNLKNKDLIEYTDCTICSKEVLHESILCQTCQHWIHAECAGVNRNELISIGSSAFGDWMCQSCSGSEMADTPCLTNLNLMEEYQTFTYCSICTKQVKGESLCCAFCKHWVHRKCIGKFSNRGKYKEIDSFESMNEYYKEQDWFCLECLKDMFPLISLPDDEFLLACLETFKCISPSMREICRSLIHLDVLNDDTDNFKFDEKSLLDGIDPDKNSFLIANSQYIFDINELKVTHEPEISVINFNIRSIRQNFYSFNNILSNMAINFDVITLTETWVDDSCNLEDFEIEGYHTPIVQNRKNRVGGGVLIYLKNTFEKFIIRKSICFSDLYNNILAIEAFKNKRKYCISVCYRSPSSENVTFLQNFQKMVNNISKHNSIITGDFNYNLFNVKHHQETENFYNDLISSSFSPIITKPTRITEQSSTLIDHIWINDMTNDKIESKLLLTDITDHLPIMYIKYPMKNISGYTTTTYRQLKDENMFLFRNKLEEKDCLLTSSDLGGNANDKVSNYFQIFGDIYNECFPVKTKKVHNKILSKPWITNDLQK